MSTSELPRFDVTARPAGFRPFFSVNEQRGNGAPPWTAEAPHKLVKHFDAGDEQQAWQTWQRHLARRKSLWKHTPLEKSDPAELLPWGCSREQIDDDTRAAIAALLEDRQLPGEVQQLITAPMLSGGNNVLNERAALLHLACAYALRGLVTVVPERLWWQSLSGLCQTAIDAAAVDLASRPLLHQWLAGELPLVLAALFPELSCCANLRCGGRKALSIGMSELLDGEGMPHRRYLDIQWPLVACWTRMRSISGQCWDGEAEAQYPCAVREMLRLADCSGSSLLRQLPIEDRGKRAARFFGAAVSLSENKPNRALLHSLKWKDVARASGGGLKHATPAANHSEWAQVTVMRPRWKRSSPHLAIAYGNRTMRGELAIGRDRLLTGDWPFAVTVDGHDAAPLNDWEANCWVSDEDVDYLELEIALSHGLKLQRQLCLARKDHFLYIADAVLGGQDRTIGHSIRLPLGADVKTARHDESREARILAPNTKALVFPLSLPEWRVDRRLGELSTDQRFLELQQSLTGANLYAPLWIDLDPDRGRKPFTWRQLTVAEERRIVRRDRGVGYRVQFGKKQWLVYRSLTPPRNRTLLGHNLATDFLIARFGRNGNVKALIEVE